MTLRSSLRDYLALRRELGFTLRRDELLLTQFVTYCEEQNAEIITVELAVAWATLPERCSQVWGALRLRVVRAFARYLHCLDARHGVPPTDLLPDGPHRATPRIYSNDEITSLMARTSSMRSALRGASTTAIIGLLASTGLRIGEALALDRDDVDLNRGVLTIRHAKFDTSRLVPLHSTSVVALGAYARERDRLMVRAKTPAFFLSATGTRVLHCNFHSAFHESLARVTRAGESGSGRVHDLRHTFAVSVLERWYEEGVDVAAKLPALSIYLGHASPSSTYWYLSGSPELLGRAARLLEATYEDAS